jgi:hypothetical protein
MKNDYYKYLIFNKILAESNEIKRQCQRIENIIKLTRSWLLEA